MKRQDRVVIHVTLDNLFDSVAGHRLEVLLETTDGLKSCLERHGEGWERPAADEAVLVTAPPWKEESRDAFRWAESLRDDVTRSVGLDVSVGIASTRLAARVASRLARPRGLLLLLPGYDVGFIDPVPLEELDELRAEQAAALRRRGLRSLGDVARLAEEEARGLLGSDAEKILGLTRGVDGATVRERASRLDRALELLCQRAAKRLAQGRWGARGLELKLLYRDGVVLERYTLLQKPAVKGKALEGAARSLLRLFPARGEPLVGLSLTATGLAPQPGQLPLFPRGREREITVHVGRP